jgi:hypothetical protein
MALCEPDGIQNRFQVFNNKSLFITRSPAFDAKPVFQIRQGANPAGIEDFLPEPMGIIRLTSLKIISTNHVPMVNDLLGFEKESFPIQQ